MAAESTSNPPVPIEELTKITTEACEQTLKDATDYDHEKVGDWNSKIISVVLNALVEATKPTEPTEPTESNGLTEPSKSTKSPLFRFIVNSTIVQQGMIDKSVAADGVLSNAGKRGVHSASGAFWDLSRDGMWTFKYVGAEERGMDVVLCITWLAVIV